MAGEFILQLAKPNIAGASPAWISETSVGDADLDVADFRLISDVEECVITGAEVAGGGRIQVEYTGDVGTFGKLIIRPFINALRSKEGAVFVGGVVGYDI